MPGRRMSFKVGSGKGRRRANCRRRTPKAIRLAHHSQSTISETEQMSELPFDVALSFSGAQRSYVETVATALAPWGARVFYDADFEIEMWGSNLVEYLQDVYQNKARFVVMFISKEYATAAYPTKERRSAFSGELHGSSTVLPVRFDDTEVPGLDRDALYVDARVRTPEEVAELIARKLERDGVPLRRPAKSSSTAVSRAAASQDIVIRVLAEDGSPVADASVAVVGANGNVVRATHSVDGAFRASVPQGRLVDLWVGHEHHSAHLEPNVEPGSDIEIRLGRAADTGSTVFFGSTGLLPSVAGRFNPIYDSVQRYYVYIDNAAANGQPARPFRFTPGEAFEVEDATGAVTAVTILATTGNGSLIEYVGPPAPRI